VRGSGYWFRSLNTKTFWGPHWSPRTRPPRSVVSVLTSPQGLVTLAVLRITGGYVVVGSPITLPACRRPACEGRVGGPPGCSILCLIYPAITLDHVTVRCVTSSSWARSNPPQPQWTSDRSVLRMVGRSPRDPKHPQGNSKTATPTGADLPAKVNSALRVAFGWPRNDGVVLGAGWGRWRSLCVALWTTSSSRFQLT